MHSLKPLIISSQSPPFSPSYSNHNLSSSTKSGSTVVKVICRMRPKLAHESPAEKPVVQVVSSDEIRITDPVKKLANRFNFSTCYDEGSSQEEIFDTEVKAMVLGVFIGVTASIFAFGCTGSGKTHTLQGSPCDPGITPRAARAIFEHMGRLKGTSAPDAQYKISVSCFEIWKDKVWDLLADPLSTKHFGRNDLLIRETANGDIFIPNLRHVELSDINHFDKIYRKVVQLRTTSSTKLNNLSSRSHAVLSLHVNGVTEGTAYEGKCVLVDLAGSENNKKTGNEENKERMKESVEINQSLLALRKVVRALNAGDSRIPYRDSKLTRILSDCLGGSSAALVICNIAPGASHYRDTMNTLTFGSLSRNVENKVVVREVERPELSPRPSAPLSSFYGFPCKSAPHLPLSGSFNHSLHPFPPLPELSTGSDLDSTKRPFFPGRANNRLPSTRGPNCLRLDYLERQPTLPPDAAGKEALLVSAETRPLQIKKKNITPTPISPPFSAQSSMDSGSSISHTSSSHRCRRDRLPSSDSCCSLELSHDRLEKKVTEVLNKNIDVLVQKQVDALVETRLKESQVKLLQSQRTMTEDCRRKDNQEQEKLLERITNLEQQFMSITSIVNSIVSPRQISGTKIPVTRYN